MKKISLLLVSLFFVFAVFSQETDSTQVENEYKTIFKDNKISIGGYGAPFVMISGINNQISISTGGLGGVLINQRISFGGYGTSLTTSLTVNYTNSIYSSVLYTNVDVKYEHGGLLTGYVFYPNMPIHPSVLFLLGWGEVSSIDNYYNSYLKEEFIVFTPILELEMNITSFFKIAIGGNASLTTITKFHNLGLNYGANVTFKFGWFK